MQLTSKMDPSLPVLPRKPLTPFIRYPVLLLTYSLLPLLWVLSKFGLTEHLFMALTKHPRIKERFNHSFGQYQPTQHDVIVCAYLKSGTNWMMQIAYQIATRAQGEFEHIHDVIPWPDAMKPTYAVDIHDDRVRQASPTGLRVIKTHLEQTLVPYNQQARYIWVVRDPKDVFVSSYHFFKSVMLGPLMPSVTIWYNLFLSEHFILGSWLAHLMSYWSIKDRENVLCLTFKDMIEDLPAVVQRVADFMGVTLSPEELALVCHKSSFQYMKTIDHKFYPGIVSPWGSKQGKMMRKGQRGSSAELLTPEQQEQIDTYFKDKLQKYQCHFPYDDTF